MKGQCLAVSKISPEPAEHRYFTAEYGEKLMNHSRFQLNQRDINFIRAERDVILGTYKLYKV